MAEGGWTRREFGGAAALVALALGLPTAAAVFSKVDDSDAPTDRQRNIMREVAELVIPTTDTPGGGPTGTGDFVLLGLAHGMEGARDAVAPDSVSSAMLPHLRRDGSLRHADWLEQVLDNAVGGDWPAKPSDTRRDALARLDAEAFSDGNDGHPWRLVKGLIVTGYYTSEAGGSQELAYDAVPGRFDPAVPVTPGMRAYSNDWTGVDFG